MEENKIDYGPKFTVNFKINEVMKFFDYEIHEKLKNSDLSHNSRLVILFNTLLDYLKITK